MLQKLEENIHDR